MHPAPSIIFFSVASGLGFGTMAFLGLGLGAGSLIGFFVQCCVGFGMAAAGLVSSTFHLGNPQRALKAFTQWRSSWLSREAWCAVAAFGCTGAFAVSALFGSALPVLGWIGAALSMLTVFTTSMIYAQLKTVPRWHHWSTPATFMIFALAGGALVTGQTGVAMGALAALGLLLGYGWLSGDRRFGDSGSNVSTATQLGDKVRAFEAPHTGPNYLLREMVHQIGRKHARLLRTIALVGAVIVPIGMLVLPSSAGLMAVIVAIHLGGALAHRWIFFAEAEHVVGLYYGRQG